MLRRQRGQRRRWQIVGLHRACFHAGRSPLGQRTRSHRRVWHVGDGGADAAATGAKNIGRHQVDGRRRMVANGSGGNTAFVIDGGDMNILLDNLWESVHHFLYSGKMQVC